MSDVRLNHRGRQVSGNHQRRKHGAELYIKTVSSYSKIFFFKCYRILFYSSFEKNKINNHIFIIIPNHKIIYLKHVKL